MTDAKADLDKPYDPREVEERWYAFWEKEGVFDATDDPADTRAVYVIPMPPPNVTGSLHMGHALIATLEDVLIALGAHARQEHALAARHRPRRHRDADRRRAPARAREARPATTSAARRSSSACGSGRHESGGTITKQQRVLGASPDWPRTKFTMDPDLSVAVTEAFVRLYEDGPHLPRHAPHQLVPRVPHGALGSRGRERGGRERRALPVRLQGRRRPPGEYSSSPRRGPRRCSATRRSPCTPTTRVTSTCTARSSCTRSSIGRSRSSPTRSSSTRSSAPAP